jgi:hypothetical protein
MLIVCNLLPKTLYRNNSEFKCTEVFDIVANYSDKTIKDIIETARTNNNVYNGTRTVKKQSFFISREQICEWLISLEVNNSEGYDQIPQRILLDGTEILLDPLTTLFH